MKNPIGQVSALKGYPIGHRMEHIASDADGDKI